MLGSMPVAGREPAQPTPRPARRHRL